MRVPLAGQRKFDAAMSRLEIAFQEQTRESCETLKAALNDPEDELQLLARIASIQKEARHDPGVRRKAIWKSRFPDF